MLGVYGCSKQCYIVLTLTHIFSSCLLLYRMSNKFMSAWSLERTSKYVSCYLVKYSIHWFTNFYLNLPTSVLDNAIWVYLENYCVCAFYHWIFIHAQILIQYTQPLGECYMYKNTLNPTLYWSKCHAFCWISRQTWHISKIHVIMNVRTKQGQFSPFNSLLMSERLFSNILCTIMYYGFILTWN